LFVIGLVPLALASLGWAVGPALRSSDDLTRRAEEVALFVQGLDPYDDPDMTYPPSAPPVFTALVAPFPSETLRPSWLALNLGALGLLCWLTIRTWGREWPVWLQAAMVLAIVATKSVRGGIALGQFHLVPLCLGLLAANFSAARPVLAGCFLGVAFVKPTMVLPLVFLLAVRGRWLALIVAGATQVGLWLLTSAWLRIDPLTLGREWVALARGQEAAGTIDWPSLVGRLWPGATGLMVPITLTCLALTLVACLGLRRRDDRDLLPIAFFAAAVFSYHRAYDLVLLLPALAWFVDRAWKDRGPWPALSVVFGLVLIWPSHPSMTGRLEWLYEPVFIPLAHAAGAVLVVIPFREVRDPKSRARLQVAAVPS
jgi:hypothetical protein